MKIAAEITTLETEGVRVRVTAQGTMPRMADWRPMLRIQFDAPDYLGKNYRIGQKIRIAVT